MKKHWLVIAALLTLLMFIPLLACDDDDDDDDDDNDDNDDVTPDDDDDDNDDNDDVTPDDDDTTPDDDDDDDYVVPPVNNPEPYWPEWVLKHWVWEDASTQESALEMVDGFLNRDIPVGAIIIDSPWATGYSTFEFDPALFADPQGMIDDLHALGIRVFLWTVPNVNVDSPNYQEGFDNGYYINNGRTVEWWKGEGSFIDFNNPDAMAWWHGMIDNVLDMGIDGWKTDGTAFYTLMFIMVQTATGPISPKEYQEQYYTDFFEYTREQLGPDRVITARPVDSYGIPFWGPSFAPRDVNPCGWVGDQDGNWFGLNAALTNMYFSGVRGFVNFGSDVSGYRGGGQRETELFVRWVQLGAFSPVMEQGNPDDIYPWDYGADVLNLYRDYVLLHHQLIPYMYSQGAHYYDDGLSVYRPILKFNWHHNLGDDLLVAPIAGPGGEKEVNFPDGDTWVYWFDGTEYEGGTVQDLEFDLEEYPVFVRKGAILPLDFGENSILGPGADGRAPITAVIYQSEEGATTHIYEEGGTGADIDYAWAKGLLIHLSATDRAYAFLIKDVDAPGEVLVDPAGELSDAGSLETLATSETGFFYDSSARELWIKPGNAQQGVVIEVN